MSDKYRHASFLLHGDFGTGKTMAAGGLPGPALVFDCEGGFNDVPGIRRVEWNPVTQPPPKFTEEDDDLFVMIRAKDWQTLNAGLGYLRSREVKPETVIFDSATEMQRILKDKLTASGTTGFDFWDQVLSSMLKAFRELRDRVDDPINPINLCVVCSSDFEAVKTGDAKVTKAVPLLQGALRKQIAGLFDVFGFMTISEDDGKNWMYLRPGRTYAAKCRLHVVNLAYPQGAMQATLDPPTLMTILKLINSDKKAD